MLMTETLYVIKVKDPFKSLLNVFHYTKLENILKMLPFISKYEMKNSEEAICFIKMSHPKKPYLTLKINASCRKYILNKSIVFELASSNKIFTDERIRINKNEQVMVRAVLRLKEENLMSLEYSGYCTDMNICNVLGTELVKTVYAVAQSVIECAVR